MKGFVSLKRFRNSSNGFFVSLFLTKSMVACAAERKNGKESGDPRGRSFGRLRRRVENYEGAFSIARLLHPATAMAAPALDEEEEIPMYHSLFSLLTYLALLLLPPRPSLRLPLRQSGITRGREEEGRKTGPESHLSGRRTLTERRGKEGGGGLFPPCICIGSLARPGRGRTRRAHKQKHRAIKLEGCLVCSYCQCSTAHTASRSLWRKRRRRVLRFHC